MHLFYEVVGTKCSDYYSVCLWVTVAH